MPYFVIAIISLIMFDQFSVQYAAPSYNILTKDSDQTEPAIDKESRSSSSQIMENVHQTDFKLHLLPLPEQKVESVKLEEEGVPSKILTIYDDSQKRMVDETKPVVIIDTISESEKYGNEGDMFDGISRTIVNGYEAFSNLLNSLIQKPKDTGRSISKGITRQLDIIGGKLVGL